MVDFEILLFCLIILVFCAASSTHTNTNGSNESSSDVTPFRFFVPQNWGFLQAPDKLLYQLNLVQLTQYSQLNCNFEEKSMTFGINLCMQAYGSSGNLAGSVIVNNKGDFTPSLYIILN